MVSSEIATFAVIVDAKDENAGRSSGSMEMYPYPVIRNVGDAVQCWFGKGFRSTGRLQRFVSVISALRNLFVPPRQPEATPKQLMLN